VIDDAQVRPLGHERKAFPFSGHGREIDPVGLERAGEPARQRNVVTLERFAPIEHQQVVLTRIDDMDVPTVGRRYIRIGGEQRREHAHQG